MKKNNVLRLILDFSIAALFLLEINYDFIGGKLHEINGLIIGGLVVVHCVSNRKWFVNLFVKKTEYTISRLFRMVINLILIIGIIALILSGMLISIHISPSITTPNLRLWSEIHSFVVKACEILLFIHILLHGKYIITCFIKGGKWQKAIMGIGALLLIATIVLGLSKGKKDEKYESLLRVPRSSGEKSGNLDINEPVQESAEKPKDSGDINTRDTINQKAGKLLLKFNFNRASTLASNQYAIWIEDSKGNLVKTLYASDFTVHGGYRYRPDSLKFWVRKSNLASMSDSKVDAVSGATPRAGQQTYIWDCKDDQGNIVPNGEYHFYLEGTLYWSSDVLFSGSFTVGGESKNNIQILGKYTENTETNRDMISSVTANYVVD
jgi:Predicted periplasmic protein